MDDQLLKELFEQLPDSVYLIEPTTSNIVYCNRMGYESLALEADEVLNHSVLTLQKDISGMPAWEDIAEEIRRVETFTFMGRHHRKNNGEIPVEVNTTTFHHDGNEYFLSVARDITNRRLHHDALDDHEKKLWFVLNETSDGLWEWNLLTDQVYFSPQLKRMLGYGPDEMSPDVSTWSNNIHPDDTQQVMRAITDHLESRRERYEAEYRLKNRNGHFIWVHDRGKVSERNQLGEPLRMVGMVQNITERKNLEQRLQEMASHDDLTGIMNRREGVFILEKQIDFSKRLSLELGICIFDLDHFKKINDKYGHLTGDKVLKMVAAIVTDSIRKLDYFYRWGGEEFILVLPDTSMEKLEVIAEKIRLAIESYPWKEKLGVKKVTASFGLSVYPHHGTNQQDLILNADAAMYQAKSSGRNCVAAASIEV